VLLAQHDLPQFNLTESQSRHWIERASCAARNNQDPDDEALGGPRFAATHRYCSCVWRGWCSAGGIPVNPAETGGLFLL